MAPGDLAKGTTTARSARARANGKKSADDDEDEGAAYVCPMHSDFTTNKPGKVHALRHDAGRDPPLRHLRLRSRLPHYSGKSQSRREREAVFPDHAPQNR